MNKKCVTILKSVTNLLSNFYKNFKTKNMRICQVLVIITNYTDKFKYLTLYNKAVIDT